MRLVWPLLLVSCGGQIASPSNGNDAGNDAPTVTSACVAAGGEFCSPPGICPVGFEPVSNTDTYDCGVFPSAWCCKKAPPSPCSSGNDGVLGNCVSSCGPANASGCGWIVGHSPVACESGKVCCSVGCD